MFSFGWKNTKIFKIETKKLPILLLFLFFYISGPDHVAALGPVAGPGLRTGPSPVLGPEVVQNQLTEMIPRKMGPKMGPNLGPTLGPDHVTDLIPNQNLDRDLVQEMIKM